jgi:two-component system, cell cycle sensor histidine kinase PleC
MCPASHRPNPGLFDREQDSCAEPKLVIDAVAGLLLAANPGGWAAWGLDAATVAPPVALDSAMPALLRLREIAGGNADTASVPEALTFWTARGGVRLVCRIAPDAAAGGIVSVRVLVPEQATRVAHCSNEPTGVAFDARLAHELRTPLSAVIAYAEILKDEHFGPLASARYKGYARDIYDSARHALGVVDSMLRSDRGGSTVPPLAMAELDPARVVESCLTVARPLAERAGLVLGVQLEPRLPRIVADELSLKQMLLNLLSNAIKFARPGDRVTVAVAAEGDAALRISVIDTGPGMAMNGAHAPCAAASQVDTVRSAAPGLGLGLPLSRALAAANGATLGIQSAPGEGTRATISFGPDRIVAARAAATEPAAASGDPAPLGAAQ